MKLKGYDWGNKKKEEERKRKEREEKNFSVIELWVDGSCWHKSRNGGWAFVIVKQGNMLTTRSGSESDTTISRMELMAVIKGLNALQPAKVTVYSDSAYTVNSGDKWIEGWKMNDWRTSTNKPVKNKDLMLKLDEAMERHVVTWQHVPGHSGHEFNEVADSLASEARCSIEDSQHEEAHESSEEKYGMFDPLWD